MTAEESRCVCDPDYRYGYDDRCPEHGYRAQKKRQQTNEIQEHGQTHSQMRTS